jgi:nucleotide-binding universal stress UspA family protein
MRSIRKILVPTDFSDGAREALDLAVDLSRRLDASITLFHVWQFPVYPIPEGMVFPSAEAISSTMAKVNDALTKLKKMVETAGVPIDTKAEQGTPFVDIVRTAKSGGYDLIVMGTHGRTGLRHLLLGSVAENVVRKAHCPVLTVRRPDHKFEHPLAT